MCGKRGETVQHIYECKILAQREYKRRHDTVAKLVNAKMCEEHNLERKKKWYEHCTEGAVEDDDVELIWDINIQCDNDIEARRPDLILVDKKVKSCVIEADLEEDAGSARPLYFLQSLVFFFVITLKNYKLCHLKLN